MPDENYEKARIRINELKDFYEHLIIFVIIITGLSIFNFFTSPQFYWVLFVVLFWGIGLLLHGIFTFGRRGFLSKEWEERKIKEYMAEEKK